MKRKPGKEYKTAMNQKTRRKSKIKSRIKVEKTKFKPMKIRVPKAKIQPEITIQRKEEARWQMPCNKYFNWRIETVE